MTVQKVTLNLTEENVRSVEKIAQDLDTNKTTVVNRAIILEKLVHEANSRDAKILIEEKDGSIKELIIR
jgi:hypothetical protein